MFDLGARLASILAIEEVNIRKTKQQLDAIRLLIPEEHQQRFDKLIQQQQEVTRKANTIE